MRRGEGGGGREEDDDIKIMKMTVGL